LRRRFIGEKHPATGNSYGNVGAIYGELGEHQNNLSYQEKALDIFQEVSGKAAFGHSQVCDSRHICSQKKWVKFEKAGKRSAAEYFPHLPQNHPRWKWFEEISRPYRKSGHGKKRHRRLSFCNAKCSWDCCAVIRENFYISRQFFFSLGLRGFPIGQIATSVYGVGSQANRSAGRF